MKICLASTSATGQYRYKVKYNLESEIFTGMCTEKNHSNKLEYYCKNHNQLCCVACIAKIKGKGNGEHKDCDVCFIKKIKNTKKIN